MKRCSELDTLVTPFVDGEVSPSDRAAVTEHLGACPPCQRRATAEQSARSVVRTHAGELVAAAPVGLRERCRAASGRSPGRSAVRWPLAMAATLVLAVGGAIVYSTFINPSVAAAAQLTLDHLKCFALFDQPADLEPAEVRAALRERYGWEVAIPDRGQIPGLSLVGGRHCVYLDGSVAHLLYKKGHVPVSVFILPQGESLPQRHLQVMGHAAVAFERGGRTWVVLARQAADDVARIADEFREDR
ncbi:MAG: zf-HC2 domain-containing protein [Vicinamibacterales bacterium]|nr:zf-HC2 domain-containing protein [Vicinamibacterales bacterium]